MPSLFTPKGPVSICHLSRLPSMTCYETRFISPERRSSARSSNGKARQSSSRKPSGWLRTKTRSSANGRLLSTVGSLSYGRLDNEMSIGGGVEARPEGVQCRCSFPCSERIDRVRLTIGQWRDAGEKRFANLQSKVSISFDSRRPSERFVTPKAARTQTGMT